jgi:hypothetical protein
MAAIDKPRSTGNLIVSSVRYLLDIFAAWGVSVDAIKAEAGIRDEQLADPASLLPITQMEDLLHAVLRRWDAPLLGLQTSMPPAPEEFGVLGYIIQNCYTLNDIFTATIRYKDLIGDLGITRVEQIPGATVCSFECTSLDPVLARHCVEHIIGCWMGHTLLLKSEKNPVLEVRFRHAPPADPALLERYQDFFHCPVLFNQSRNCIVIASHAMSLPLRHPDAGLQETLEQHAREQLARLKHRHSFVAHARTRLRALMVQSIPSREALAELMGTAAATWRACWKRKAPATASCSTNYGWKSPRPACATPARPWRMWPATSASARQIPLSAGFASSLALRRGSIVSSICVMASTKTVKAQPSAFPVHWTLGGVHTSIVAGDTEVVPGKMQ